MVKQNSRIFKALYTLFDAAIIFFSYYSAEWLWFNRFTSKDNFLQDSNMRISVFYGVCAYIVVALMATAASKIYNNFRYKNIFRVWLGTSTIHAVLICVSAVLFYIFHLDDVSRGMLAVFFAILSLAYLIKHLFALGVLRLIRRLGYNQKHLILVGCGPLAEEYAQTVNTNKHYGITIDGYIAKKENDKIGKYLGGYDDLESHIKGTGVDEVVIAVSDDETKHILSLINCCEKCGTRVSVIPFYNSMISSTPAIDKVGNLKCFTLRTSPLDNLGSRFIKRAFDIAFSLFILLLLSPFMLIIALLVKCTSPGPVFFKQQRVGKDKKLFTMYKFRSMKVNAESDTAWSSDVDPRRTAFGSFIRKMSIDELPQFFNVLKGDMSIIGPRPEIPHYVEQFREEIPRYMLKHLVRPGITGWAQVNGYRGDTSIEKRIQYDIWYIENWSAWLDAKIMFKTVFGGMINSEKMAKDETEETAE